MKSLAKKLVLIRRHIKDPIKSGRNKFHNYDYSTKDDVFEVLRPALAEFGVAALPSQTAVRFIDTNTKTKSGVPIRKVVVEMTVTLIDEDSGETFVQHLVGESDTEDDKGIPQATTQALRFWAINTFQLLDGEVEYMDEVHTSPPKTTKIHREEATPTRDESIKTIESRFRELEFSKAQYELFRGWVAKKEEVERFEDLSDARLLVWANNLQKADEPVRKRLLQILKIAEKQNA